MGVDSKRRNEVVEESIADDDWHQMNKETNLNSQQPEERITREVWEKLERGLKKVDNRLFRIQFFVSNIAQYIGESFEKNNHTEQALGLCASIILAMGWELNFAMKQARVESIFTKFILEAAKDKELDCNIQRVQHQIALRMNWELQQALAEYIKEGNENIKPIYEEAKQLRWTMNQLFSL